MKKVLNKVLALFLALSFFLYLSACSNEGTKNSVDEQKDSGKQTSEQTGTQAMHEKEEPITLIFWTGIPGDRGMDQMAEEYTKLTGGQITVTHNRYVAREGDATLETALMSGEQIDGYFTHNTYALSRRMSNGLALDLSPMLKQRNFDPMENFGEVVKPLIGKNGEILALPTTLMNFHIMLNMDALKEAGLEMPDENWTVEDLVNYAKKLTKGSGSEKIYGFFTDWTELAELLTYTALDRDFFYNSNLTEIDWDKPEFRTALKAVYQMMNIDKSAPSSVDVIAQKMSAADMFASGKAAMSLGQSFIIRNLKDLSTYPHDFVTGFACLPRIDDKHNVYYTDQTLNDYFSINPKSSYPEEMLDYYMWMITEGGWDAAIVHGRIPLYKKYDMDVVVESIFGDKANLFDIPSFVKYVAKGAENPQVPRTFDLYSEIATIMKEECQLLLLDKEDIVKDPI